MSYTSKSRIQNYLLANIHNSFDSQIAEWINVVQKWIDGYTGTTFEQVDTSKKYDGNGTSELLIDDLVDFTKVEILDEDGNVDYTVDGSDEYYLYPANKTPKNKIVLNVFNAPIGWFIKGRQNVKVYGQFGASDTVPYDIQHIATVLVAGIIQQSNFDIGSEIQSESLGEYSVTFRDVDKLANQFDIMKILDRYRNIPL